MIFLDLKLSLPLSLLQYQPIIDQSWVNELLYFVLLSETIINHFDQMNPKPSAEISFIGSFIPVSQVCDSKATRRSILFHILFYDFHTVWHLF